MRSVESESDLKVKKLKFELENISKELHENELK